MPITLNTESMEEPASSRELQKQLSAQSMKLDAVLYAQCFF